MAVAKVGVKALAVAKENKAQVTPNFKRQTKKILDEDTYIEDLEKIIQRDFFPDLERLAVQKEYLEAKQRNDLVKMRSLALKFAAAAGRPNTGTPGHGSVASTPSTFETPDPHSTAPAATPNTSSGELDSRLEEEQTSNPEPTGKDEKAKSDSTLSLDKYLLKHTSEDNAAFVDIMESSQEKVRQRHAWLYEAVDKQAAEQDEMLQLKGPETLALEGPSDKNVRTWTYTPKNMLMYVPEGMEYSSTEKFEDVKKKQLIKHNNTRFESNPFAVSIHKSNMAQAAAQQASKMQGKIGADGKELIDMKTATVKGYGFVATPSPAPGINESPLMTWGEIESTPFRLEGGSTPKASPGPQFKMPGIPRRDRLGHSLVEQANKQRRDKKEAALKRVTKNLSSPSPRFGSIRSSERLQYLSPAARRLVNKSVSRVSTDKSLRASYTPSPRTPLSGDKTPILQSTPGSTPKKTPSRTSRTPKTTPKRTESVSITDNLLDLPRRSTRQQASDFF